MKKMTAALLVCFFTALAFVSHAQWNLTGNSNATTSSLLGTTNAIPLNLTTNNTKRLVIDANGKVGIGTATPVNILTVKGAGSTPAASWVGAGSPLFVGFGETTVGNADFILNMGAAAANARPVFVGRKSRGTLAAPGVVANNDNLMSFLASGYDGSAFQNPAAVDFYVDGAVSAGNMPARISFVTGSNGTNRKERLKIGNTGDVVINDTQLVVKKGTGYVGIGTIAPIAKLQVKGGDALINEITVGTGSGNVVTNTSIGHLALYFNTTGNNNTAEGEGALYSNNTGNANTATGQSALSHNTTGNANTACGQQALPQNTTGSFNTSVGQNSAFFNTTGSGNTAIGWQALSDGTTDNYNTAVGNQAGIVANSSIINSTALGNSAIVDASNKIRIGNSSVSSIGGQVGWTNFSDGRIKQNIKENVPGLTFINQLKPVTYNFNLAKEYELMGRKDTLNWVGKYDIEKINFTGFIAQDVEAAAKKIDYDFSGVDKRGKIMGLRYSEFVVPLVKAVQELSEENKQLKANDAALQKQIDELKEALMKVFNTKTPSTTSK